MSIERISAINSLESLNIAKIRQIMTASNITSTQVVPGDFDAAKFKEKDIQIGIDRRNDLIILEIVVDRYESLFGAYPEADKIKELIPNWTSKIK